MVLVVFIFNIRRLYDGSAQFTQKICRGGIRRKCPICVAAKRPGVSTATAVTIPRKAQPRVAEEVGQKLNRFVEDDDWLLWDFQSERRRGKHVESVRK